MYSLEVDPLYNAQMLQTCSYAYCSHDALSILKNLIVMWETVRFSLSFFYTTKLHLQMQFGNIKRDLGLEITTFN
jgi:hypothetical protein